MSDSKTTPPDPVIEAVAKALYAIEWEAVSGNLRDGHFSYEEAIMRDKTEQAYDAAAGYCLDAMQSLRRFSDAEAVAALRSAIDAIEREQQRAKREDRIRVRPAPMLFPVPKDSAERFGDFSRDDG